MKNYNEMNNDEKAQTIMDNASNDELQQLVLDLSWSYDEYGVREVYEWLESITDRGAIVEDIVDIIQVAQESKELDINKKYIRGGIHYYDYKTSDNALDLVDDEELSEWIESALDDDNPMIENINEELEIEAMQEGLKND